MHTMRDKLKETLFAVYGSILEKNLGFICRSLTEMTEKSDTLQGYILDCYVFAKKPDNEKIENLFCKIDFKLSEAREYYNKYLKEVSE